MSNSGRYIVAFYYSIDDATPNVGYQVGGQVNNYNLCTETTSYKSGYATEGLLTWFGDFYAGDTLSVACSPNIACNFRFTGSIRAMKLFE